MDGRRPRIRVLIKGLGRGGAERLLSQGALFWNTAEFDYQVGYFLPWKDQLVPDLLARGVTVDCFGGDRGMSPGAVRRAGRACRAADLVHAHLPSTGIIARLVSRAPVVYTEHNIVDSYRPLVAALNRITYRRNRAVIAVSAAVADSVAQYPGPDVEVIPNGVSCHVDPVDVERLRTELEVGTGPLVVHVGNIRPHKGHSTLIRAAHALESLAPSATIVSVGGEKHAGDLARVRAEAAGVRNIRFVGSREDATTFLAAADVVVNPSDFEGLPVVLLEALSLGRPVVATRVGGVPTIIRDGSTGLLVEANDATGLAKGVAELLQDPNRARWLGANGRALVQNEFGLEQMVRRTEDVYRRVLYG